MAQANALHVQAKKKNKVHVFDIVNYIVFVIIALIVLIPIWKVLVDSFNAVGVYQFRFWPEDFTFNGYLTIFTTVRQTPLTAIELPHFMSSKSAKKEIIAPC